MALAARLRVWLGLTETHRAHFVGFLRGLFVENWAVKLGAFLVVALSWLVVREHRNEDGILTCRCPLANLTPAGHGRVQQP
jgi:hypothetical protein